MIMGAEGLCFSAVVTHVSGIFIASNNVEVLKFVKDLHFV